jgi:hypothetical protein
VVVDASGCPSDAATWSSTAFSPETKPYYFLALEECVGQPTGYPDQTGQHYLRALNIETGEIAWEILQPGSAHAKTWSGELATAGGVLFYDIHCWRKSICRRSRKAEYPLFRTLVRFAVRKGLVEQKSEIARFVLHRVTQGA